MWIIWPCSISDHAANSADPTVFANRKKNAELILIIGPAGHGSRNFLYDSRSVIGMNEAAEFYESSSSDDSRPKIACMLPVQQTRSSWQSHTQAAIPANLSADSRSRSAWRSRPSV